MYYRPADILRPNLRLETSKRVCLGHRPREKAEIQDVIIIRKHARGN